MFIPNALQAALGIVSSLSPITTMQAKLTTPWNDAVGPTPLNEYPRPQMVRDQWLNLNGEWKYKGGKSLDLETIPDFSDSETIQVPFPPESYLSGVMRDMEINMWYERSFTVPEDWTGRTLLHFEAVAETSVVYVNGKLAGHHSGRYGAFEFDVTDLLRSGDNIVTVGANDPHDGTVSCGKNAGLGDYVFTSGIWQTVWMEPVPGHHIRQLTITPNLKESTVTVNVDTNNVGQVQVSVLDGEVIGTGAGSNGTDITINVPDAKTWSPNSPFLYDLEIRLGSDLVRSYFGMRSIELGKKDGILRPLLNGDFTLQLGVLDQGYWPDGIQTPPSDEAILNDLKTVKALGWNMVRKHAKVEPQRWYYWADKLGLLVWQDMPSMWHPDTPEVRSQFESEWDTVIQQHYNSPSIVVWVPFNENWGAYDAPRITEWTKKRDSTRLVSGNSGYNNAPPYRPPQGDPGNGDFNDTHQYDGALRMPVLGDRASALGEYGGIGLLVEGHMWPGVDHNAYEMEKTVEALTKRVVAFQHELVPLIRKGLSAVVYTQLTDVEHEVNGVLTYDRKVRKVDFGSIEQVNRAVLRGTL